MRVKFDMLLVDFRKEVNFVPSLVPRSPNVVADHLR